MNSNLIEY